MSGSLEAQLQATLNMIPAHTWYAAPSGVLTFVNKRCADYLGLPHDHPLRSGIVTGIGSDTHTPIMHPDDHDATRKVWSNCVRTETPYEMVFRARSGDGGYRWFIGRAEPLRANDGKLIYWVGINLDIEERKQAEFYLAEGQRLAHTGSWAFNAAGFGYWSPELFEIHGLQAGRPPNIAEYLALAHPEDREYIEQTIRQILSAPQAFDFTKRIVRPDKEVRHIRCVGVPAANGGFIGTGIDVTEQEQLTRALRRSEEELRQILDSTPLLITVLGPDHERLYINRMALDFLGRSLEDWQREVKENEAHPGDLERLIATEKHGRATGKPYDVEARFRRHDGNYRWLLARFNPLRDDAGRVIRWFVACTDIDDRKKAEERLQQENVALREAIDRASMFEEIVGTSSALSAVLSRVSKVAVSDSTVLISGETGTGKELIARAIHRRSKRSAGAFVAVNCAAIPPELIASELFGHEKGAFTGATQMRPGRFELADGGTIFLDEVGELLPDTQVALLRVLQEFTFERVGGREQISVNVRVIAATNRDLDAAIANGAFRQDLFYRLNVFPLEMPPLRARKEDIPLLVEYFIHRFARNAGKSFRRVNKRTLEQLQSYPWPGNVRELQNVIERSVIVCDSDEFKVDESWISAEPKLNTKLALSSDLVAREKTIIEEALRATSGRVFGPFGAAARLGIPRSTLESKIRALRINKNHFRSGPVKS